MKVTTSFLTCFAVLVSAYVSLGQNDRKPRIFVTDSQSWEMMGGFSGSAGLYSAEIGGGFSGGARPQTAEIMKTFGQRCNESTVTIKRENADYIIILEHEGGKGLIYRDNKFALFNKEGDSINSGSTRSLGNSVKDACTAIKQDWVSGLSRHTSAKATPPSSAPKITPNPETLNESTAQIDPPKRAVVTKVDLRETTGTDTTSAVTFQSNPDGADIEIDGKFSGNTPTLLQLKNGDHKIVIKSSGYTSWEREIAVTAGGNVLVNAVLERNVANVPPPVISSPPKTPESELIATVPPVEVKPDSSSALKSVEIRKNSIGMELVRIQLGEFTMGSPIGEKYEKPSHTVIFPDGFWMGKYEVKQSEWFAVMGSNPSSFDKCGAACPIENVSWEDAHQFIEKLNAKNDGFVYSLPTEAEWEYAARAGNAYSANALDGTAWYDKNSNGKTHPAGEKQPNAFGLYDMLGNVWEWCEDWYGDYAVASVTNPKGPAKGKYRVLRGGAWKDGGSDMRTTYRAALKPSFKYKDSGFRVVARPR